MGNRDTYRDTLTYALAIAGSEQDLAEHLRASVRQVQNWLKGTDPIPDHIFHAALDVVIGSSRQAIHRSRELMQKMTR